MSWYNQNENNDIIDATQQLTGGSGGLGTSEITTQEAFDETDNQQDTGTDTSISNVFFPAVFNEETGTFDVYIKNVNQDGRIFLTTKGDNTQIKVEDGKLFLYYNYDITNAPLIPGGWTDIVRYAVGSRSLLDTAILNIAGIDTTLYTPITGLVARFPIVEATTATLTASSLEHERRLKLLEDFSDIRNIQPEDYNFEQLTDFQLNQSRSNIRDVADNFLEMINNSTHTGGNARNLALAVSRTRQNFLLSYLTNVVSALGGFSLVVGIAFGIYDRITQRSLDDREAKVLLSYERIKDIPSSNISNLIHPSGLQIVPATNTGFTTAGTYEVDIAHSNTIEIEVKLSGQVLIAEIKEMVNTSSGFAVNDTISIPKSSLGGGTGNLEINVSQLFSERELLGKLLDEIETERNEVQNRNRRRQFIPDKNNFGDGIIVNETNITEPSGEITKNLDIKLKVDNTDFEFDANGNLKAKNIKIDTSQFQFDANDRLQIRLNLDTDFESYFNHIIVPYQYSNAFTQTINGLKTDIKALITELDEVLSEQFTSANEKKLRRITDTLKIKRDEVLETIKNDFNDSYHTNTPQKVKSGVLNKIKEIITQFELNEIQRILESFSRQPEFIDIDNLVDHTSLNIQFATNTGFSSAGTFEIEVETDVFFTIEISGNPLIASITRIRGGGSGIGINYTWNVDKSLLGGTTGQITIVATLPLTGCYYFYTDRANALETELDNLRGKLNKRDELINKSHFAADGFDITETTSTDALTGETLKDFTIALNIDTTHFEYDQYHNLQLKNFSKITTNETNITNLTTTVQTNTNDITTINNVLSGYGGSTLDVWSIILPSGQTFTTNTSKKMELGYKTEFTGFPMNLITLAYKTTPTILNTDETGLDILGFYPSLQRLTDADNIKLVKATDVRLNSDFSFKKGNLFIENSDPLIDYDLSRPVEFIIFLKPYNLSSYTNEYVIFQSGTEIAPDEFEIDNNKLRIGIKNNKLQLTHNVKRTYQYYPVDVSNDTYHLMSPSSYTSSSTSSSFVLAFTNPPTLPTRTYYYGVDNMNNSVSNQESRFNAIHQGFSSTTPFDMFFGEVLPKGTGAGASSVWTSPVLYHEEDPYDSSTGNIGMVRIHYEIMTKILSSGLLGIEGFSSITELQNELEFNLRINVKTRGSNAVLRTRTYEFNQINYSYTSASGVNTYVQDFYVPNAYQLNGSTNTYYNRIELELVHKGGSFTALPVGSQAYTLYDGQHAIRIHEIQYFKYSKTLTSRTDHIPYTFESIQPPVVFPTPIQSNQWYKFILNLRLDMSQLTYYVNDVSHTFTFPSELINQQLGEDVPLIDPLNNFYFTADYEFTNLNLNTLGRDNDILVIGDNSSQGEMHFTHFNWRFLQSLTQNYLTQAERDKLDELISYNFYHESVEVPRYLKCKEFYGDVVEFRKILQGGVSLYQELPPAEQTQLLSNTRTDNVLSANFNVPIDNLYSKDTTNPGYLYYDNESKSVDLLQNAQDLTGLASVSLDTSDREEFIFEHIPNGSSFTLKVRARSKTSLSEEFRLSLYEGNHQGYQRLNHLDPPYPSHTYTLTEAQITTSAPTFNQQETWESGQLQDPALNPYNPGGYSNVQFKYNLKSGDIINFKIPDGYNGVWKIYYADFLALNPTGATANVNPTFSQLTLLQDINDGDKFVIDASKFYSPYYKLYFIYNGDFTKKIVPEIKYPDCFIDNIRTGNTFQLTANETFASSADPMRFQFNAFGSIKTGSVRLFADDRPITVNGVVISTTNGRPANPNDFYKFTYAINYATFCEIYDSGDIITTGNLYAGAEINANGQLDLPILVNRIDNLKAPNEATINGLPALRDQVFHFVVESFDIINNYVFFTGTDRVNSYTNQRVSQFEFYYNDVFKITLSANALTQYNQNPFAYPFGVKRPAPLTTLDLQDLASASPQQLYIRLQKRGNSVYSVIELFNSQNIPINLQNIISYTNPDHLPTDVYALEYLPYSNEYRWKKNYIVDSSQQSSSQILSVPSGSFSVKTSTSQISSRRTLASSVPIEKVSQITTYNVFNGEVEFNNNVIIENVNTDISVLFTIYTNENKQDPITQVNNFKDEVLDDYGRKLEI